MSLLGQSSVSIVANRISAGVSMTFNAATARPERRRTARSWRTRTRARSRGIRIGAVLRPAVLVAFTDRASLLQHEIAQPRSGYRLASAAVEIEMDELARQTRLIAAIAPGAPEHVELPQLGIPALCQQWERRTGRKDSSRAGFLDADDEGTAARVPDGGNCFLKVGEGL
jgi:hypothetical protein